MSYTHNPTGTQEKNLQPKGFTLIELMIVVAMVGILSAVALAGYNDYIKTSQTAVVYNHFEQGVRSVRWEYSTNHASVSNGIDRQVPATAAGWIELLDVNEGKAPGGGPAYIEGAASDTLGAVGVSVTGTWDAGDSQVVVSRPAFGDLTAKTETITMQ